MRVVFIFISLLSFASIAGADDATAGTSEAKLGLHHESELGYIVVGGNAKSESFSGKQATSYQWTTDLLKLSAHYLNTRAQNQTTKELEGTAENWSVQLREEHVIAPDKFSVFAQAGINGDRYIGVDLGQSYDLGVKYFWIVNTGFKFFSEAGYRYLHEDLVAPADYLESHFLRIYSQADYTFSPTVSLGLWAEYLPDIKEEDNYRVNFSPYVLTILNETFSLKFSYEGNYRNIPVAPNTERMDYRHVTALIAKF
jgi:putative salt-induced outer membrane protein YdiY